MSYLLKNRRAVLLIFTATLIFASIAFAQAVDAATKSPKQRTGQVEDLPQDMSVSEGRALKKIESLLDTTKYAEAKAEWERMATRNPRIRLRAKLAEQLKYSYFRSIQRSLDLGKHREAVSEWERVAASLPGLEAPSYLTWLLARVYVQLNQYDKAIQVFKPRHRPYLFTDRYIAPESAQERALKGEELILGALVGPATKEKFFVGRGQCTLCHAVSKGEWRQECDEHAACAPDLHGISQRTKLLLTSPEYLQRRKDSVQREAFPGSGIAATVVEYLAESNVCPSCYIVPVSITPPSPFERKSFMPTIHTPPISLSREELITIDTWILMQDGEEIPSVAAMRAAYDKFLPREDDGGSGISMTGILLASLYDAAGDLDEATRLLEQNYPIRLQKTCVDRDVFGERRVLRHGLEIFPHLKKRPDFVERFPLVLRTEDMVERESHDPEVAIDQLPWCK